VPGNNLFGRNIRFPQIAIFHQVLHIAHLIVLINHRCCFKNQKESCLKSAVQNPSSAVRRDWTLLLVQKSAGAVGQGREEHEQNFMWMTRKAETFCTLILELEELHPDKHVKDWSNNTQRHIFGSEPKGKQTTEFVFDADSQRGINAHCINSWVIISVYYSESFLLAQETDRGSSFSFFAADMENCCLVPLLLNPPSNLPALSSRMFGSLIYLSFLGSERLLRQQAQAHAEALPFQLRFLLR